MPEPTGKSSWNVLAAGSSFEKLAYLLVPVTSSQNWRGTPSARKVSTPSWTSLRQPADNVTGDSEQAGLAKPPSKRRRKGCPDSEPNVLLDLMPVNEGTIFYRNLTRFLFPIPSS